MAISPEGITFMGMGAMVGVNVIGWVISENRNKVSIQKAAIEAAKTTATEMTSLTDKLDGVQKDVTDIKRTIGNGGYVGIKQDVAAIKLNCASEMASLKTEVANLKDNGGTGRNEK